MRIPNFIGLSTPWSLTYFQGEKTISVWKVDFGETVNSTAGLITPTKA